MVQTLRKPNPAASGTPAPADQRRWKRVAIRLTGRYLDSQGRERDFHTAEASCDGALIMSQEEACLNESLICYFDELGRIAGSVIRLVPGGFVIRFNTPAYKRDKLADRLTWLLNRDDLALEEERGGIRYKAGGEARLLLSDGRELPCSVTDISLTGASFETHERPPFVGETVHVGHLRGEVVRVSGNKFALRYLHSPTSERIPDRAC